VGHAYTDRSTTAKAVASQDVTVDPGDMSVIDVLPPEEDDDPLGWFVSLLIQANASEG
jgi:hypothetical protein